MPAFDGERPTLPPIRDLFHDLCIHDSPSLTLARLRVSDDHDTMRPRSSLGLSRPEDPQISRVPRHRSPQPYASQQLPLVNHHHASRSPERFSEQSHFSSSYSSDGRHPRTLHSLSYSSEVEPSLGLPRRHASIDVPPIRSGSIPRPTSPEDPTPVARFDRRPYDHSGHKPAQRHAAWPGEISTLETSTRGAEDERTPVARYNDPSSRRVRSVSRDAEDRRSGVSASKYECSYCGKGFNRPSSLKIHLNSHTGAKPFVCPVESCGRSFSVLSNMRRHARVHTQVPLHTDPSSDDESELSSSYTGSAPPSATLSTHSRRSSIVSVSSTGSRRSHASSDDSTTLNVSRPEKRFRIDAN